MPGLGKYRGRDAGVSRYHLLLIAPRFTAKPFFEPPSEELRFLPEGPRFLQNHPAGRNRALLGWVAIQHAVDSTTGSMNVLDLASGENVNFPLPGRPGFFAETTRPGVLLVGLERRLAYLDLATGRLDETGIAVTADERVIINDGVPVEGGVLFGTKHLAFNLPIAALYYFDAVTRKVKTVLGGQTCSNGKLLQRSPDGTATLIDTDSTPKTITRYRLDEQLERIFDQSLVMPPDSLPAFPDGLRPSPDGESIVVAFFNPEAVEDGLARQFRLSDGAVLCEWVIPGSPRVTCPEFVEIDGRVKVVFTTATEGMPANIRSRAPGAGAMYIADTPFDTVPAPPPLLPQ
jgi:sugar lactone lactonase YvrE